MVLLSSRYGMSETEFWFWFIILGGMFYWVGTLATLLYLKYRWRHASERSECGDEGVQILCAIFWPVTWLILFLIEAESIYKEYDLGNKILTSLKWLFFFPILLPIALYKRHQQRQKEKEERLKDLKQFPVFIEWETAWKSRYDALNQKYCSLNNEKTALIKKINALQEQGPEILSQSETIQLILDAVRSQRDEINKEPYMIHSPNHTRVKLLTELEQWLQTLPIVLPTPTQAITKQYPTRFFIDGARVEHTILTLQNENQLTLISKKEDYLEENFGVLLGLTNTISYEFGEFGWDRDEWRCYQKAFSRDKDTGHYLQTEFRFERVDGKKE